MEFQYHVRRCDTTKPAASTVDAESNGAMDIAKNYRKDDEDNVSHLDKVKN